MIYILVILLAVMLYRYIKERIEFNRQWKEYNRFTDCHAEYERENKLGVYRED